ncbi:hypothetical protein HK102_006036 [Quaeritorhiza haematococci]|nr:hypothetical protein HK102_006036 [Quaeritorhiza haematococci]
MCDLDTSPTTPISAYDDILRNWSTPALTDTYLVDGFDKLEHQLMKRFFLDAFKENTRVLSRGSEVSEVHLAALQKLGQDAEFIASQLLFRLQNYPPKEQNTNDNSLELGVGVQPGPAVEEKPTAKLPPEILAMVLANFYQPTAHPFRVIMDEELSEGLITLASCACVNKLWASVATPLLWRDVTLPSVKSMYQFFVGRHRIRNKWWSTFDINASTSVVNLTLTCLPQQHQALWDTFIQDLHIFINLRRLRLDNCPSFQFLSSLFRQEIPSLRELNIEGNRGEFSGTPDTSRWSWDWSLPWTGSVRESAQKFFSQLEAVSFWWCDMDMEATDVPELSDIVPHQNLRIIDLPNWIPDNTIRTFIQECTGHTLSSVTLRTSQMTYGTLNNMARRCKGLRALSLDCADLSHAGFLELIRYRGPGLRYLELGNDVDVVDSVILGAIGEYCTSLEHLELDFCTLDREGGVFEESYLKMVRDVGGSLKYLSMHAEWFHRTDTLLRTLGENCPLLEGLMMPTNTIPSASSASISSAHSTDSVTEIPSGTVSPPTLSNLLTNCKHLRWLGLPHPQSFCEPPFSLQLTETVRERVVDVCGTVDEDDVEGVYDVFRDLAAKYFELAP